MTAQLPATSYAFGSLSTSAFQHDISPPTTTTSEHSTTHDCNAAMTATTNQTQSRDSSHHASDTTPFSSTATPSSSYFPHAFTSPPLSINSEEIPKLGSIRCYWTILSPSLDYVYLDPLLEHHLGEHAQQFLGSNLLDFVHPDERDQLAEDLLPKPDRIAGVETAGVFGSVTRLRYSRLVGILRKLGCLEVPTLPDADKYALDEDYLNLDLTTSWIAGNGIARGNAAEDGPFGQWGHGAVLAFFHVIGDKDHIKNNDQFDRGDWTNWCGVQVDEHRYFTPSRCQALVAVLERITSSSSRPSTACGSEEDSKTALLASLHGLSSETTDGPPPHVFQILDRNGKTIVSFPTPQDEDGRKRYEIESYAALAREVVARPRGAANAKTSCTKRYRSKHPVMRDSILTTIESVVIMYGSITFACFQTGGIYLTSAKKTALGLNQASLSPSPAAHDFNLEDVPSTVANPKSFLSYNKRAAPYLAGPPGLNSPPFKRPKIEIESPPRPRLSIPPGNAVNSQDSKDLSISTAFNRGNYRPSLEPEYGTNGGVSPTVASASAILGAISSSAQNDANHSTSNSSRPAENYSPYPPSSTSIFPHFRPHGASPASLYPPSYPAYPSTSPSQPPQQNENQGYFPPSGSQRPVAAHQPLQTASNDVNNQYVDQKPEHAPRASADPNTAAPSQLPKQADDGSPASKDKKIRHRPDGPIFKPGPKACESCGTTESPEWRKGPSGSKSLCNACGLRHARTVARQKKLAEQAANGIPAKKKKGKKAAKEDAQKPPSSSAAPSTSSHPTTTTALMTYEPALSRSESTSGQKTYAPFYTSAPPHSSSYAVVAAHTPTPSSLPTSMSAVSMYPASTSGYYPATTTWPFSTYPPSSAPILTHIPIHHTLAATLAPLSAPVSVHSHDYPRPSPVPTSMPHSSSFSSSNDHYHPFSQPSDHSGMYQHQQPHQQQHHPTSSGPAEWHTSYASSEIHHASSSVSSAPLTSSAPISQSTLPPSSYSSAAPAHHSMSAHSTSPHLHHPQPRAYQPYSAWPQDQGSNAHDSHHHYSDGRGGGGGDHSHPNGRYD
ncbi:hypothetical protein JCM3766R1_003883 [Sporobolomyces carnicolor]